MIIFVSLLPALLGLAASDHPQARTSLVQNEFVTRVPVRVDAGEAEGDEARARLERARWTIASRRRTSASSTRFPCGVPLGETPGGHVKNIADVESRDRLNALVGGVLIYSHRQYLVALHDRLPHRHGPRAGRRPARRVARGTGRSRWS